jgi:hypothetical protein
MQRPPLPVDVVANWWDTYGTVADWVAAVGTVGALVWALVIFWNQLQDKRREQATKVVLASETRIMSGQPPQVVCTADNLSDLPIFGIHIMIQGMGLSKGEYEEHAIHARIDPGGKKELVVDMRADGQFYKLDERLRMTFRDASYRGWTRYPNGKLKRARRFRWRGLSYVWFVLYSRVSRLQREKS